MIFFNGNCAHEEEMWKFFDMMGLYEGRRHLIFGEPRKPITTDLVQRLPGCQQVPNSDPLIQIPRGPEGPR